MKRDTKEASKHLSVLGVGPIYVSVILITTLILVLLDFKHVIVSIEFFNSLVPKVIGSLFIIIGIILWLNGAIFSKITSKIKSNALVTNGIFAYVRNPIYSAFMFICSGVIIYLNNIILLAVPVIYWMFLTVLLIKTEEIWLRELYKEDYDKYCREVNRCIPFYKKR